MAELLSVPFKKSSDVELVKPLRNLLQATYDGAEDCSEALAELARLRNDAVWKIYDKASLDVIYSYYDQLVSLESKVPPQEVQVPFKWKDAFDRGSIFGGRASLTVSSLAFERVCVLFNIGALQSALAAQQPLDSEDSLKQAAKLLQQAAGVFAQLKATVMGAVHQEPTPDLQPDALAALAALMLAQAQEVIAYKCIRDEMKDGMVARVCAQADELYTDAARLLGREPQRSLFDKDWLNTVTAKQMAFRGLTQLFQSQVCAANKQVGEQIARLQVAVEQLKGAAARLPAAAQPAEQLARAARLLAAASKDNDFIYHERVPEARTLEPVARAAVAKALEPPARWSGARDLFAALLPAAAHRALAAAAARRAEAVTHEVNALRDATQLLNSILASLNLPACLEEAGGDALPASIRDKGAAVRAAGGVPALRALMDELPQLLQRNRDILDEAERMLREEEEADAALRAQFGARWARTPSAELTASFRANAAKYRQIIDNAVRADAIVQQKFAQHREDMELLGRSEGELAAGLPAAAGGGGGAEHAAALRALVARAAALRAERDALEQDFKDVTLDLKEQFLSALAADGALDEPALTAGALGAALAPLQRRAAAAAAEQTEAPSDVAGAAGGGAADGARGVRGGRRRRRRARRRARPPVRRARRVRRPHRQPARGQQVLQRPHAAAGDVPEQDLGLLLRAAHGEGGAAEGPDAGRVARAAPRARAAARARAGAGRREEGGAAAAARARRPGRPGSPGSPGSPGRRAALPRAAARHAAAVRRGAVPVLRGAAAGGLQPLRHAALPAPRAARRALPALPAPAAAALPALLQPLRPAVAAPTRL